MLKKYSLIFLFFLLVSCKTSQRIDRSFLTSYIGDGDIILGMNLGERERKYILKHMDNKNLKMLFKRLYVIRASKMIDDDFSSGNQEITANLNLLLNMRLSNNLLRIAAKKMDFEKVPDILLKEKHKSIFYRSDVGYFFPLKQNVFYISKIQSPKEVLQRYEKLTDNPLNLGDPLFYNRNFIFIDFKNPDILKKMVNNKSIKIPDLKIYATINLQDKKFKLKIFIIPANKKFIRIMSSITKVIIKPYQKKYNIDDVKIEKNDTRIVVSGTLNSFIKDLEKGFSMLSASNH